YINGISKNKPFFTMLSFYCVHTPLEGMVNKPYYDNKRKQQGLNKLKEFAKNVEWMRYADRGTNSYSERITQGNSKYASMLGRVDYNIGRLINTLENQGLMSNTLIIFTSDNGGLNSNPTCNLPLRAGKGHQYEGGIRVPYIIKHPQLSAPGFVNTMPISNIDLYPTILSYCGIELTNSVKAKIDGIDLTPYLENGNLPDRPLYWHFPHYHGSGADPGSIIQYQGYKLFENFETGNLELYYLPDDTSEVHDLSGQMPGKVNELNTLLNEWKTSTGARSMAENPFWNGGDINREVIPSYPIHTTPSKEEFPFILTYEDGSEITEPKIPAGTRINLIPKNSYNNECKDSAYSQYVNLEELPGSNAFTFVMPLSHVYLKSAIKVIPPATNTTLNTNGLLGYFSFSNVSNNKVYCDIGSGKNAYGMLTNGAKITIQGKFGEGLQLDGKNDFLDFNQANSDKFILAGKSDATIACWVKVNNIRKGAHQDFVSMGDHQYCLKLNKGNKWTGYYFTDKWYAVKQESTLEQGNEWVHLALTHSSDNTTRLYLNGREAVWSSAPGVLSTKPAHTKFALNFGRSSETNGRFFGGIIDEVYIFNRTLSPCEIAKLPYLEPTITKQSTQSILQNSRPEITVITQNNTLIVTGNEILDYPLCLYSIDGIKVGEYTTSSNTFKINTSGLVPGAYIISVRLNGKIITKKIMLLE
ncbi:MAG: sulfatase-like hydrolase/transferase, partial [Bacteroidales bacterium]|nr:sulfatase-like hydrolase/transferase [Bacteroidales bacterium]